LNECREARGAAEQKDEQPCRKRIERTEMANTSLSVRSADDIDHVMRGHSGRFID
jgi:hypothetical protein